MKIMGGPGEYSLRESLKEKGNVTRRNKKRVQFLISYRNQKAGYAVAITSLTPRKNEEKIFDFTAEDALNQTFEGWYNVETKQGEMAVVD
ncbi:hypothetical protein IKH83_02605 [Candidatus Saccharibacteria bacterium]|nr:hypothetical protein [Candidatus Saccharibacteria bacterium]